jgi:hypothetical protein
MSEKYSISTPQTSDTERQLLVKILNALNSGSGGGGTAGVYFISTGAAPTTTPTGNAITFDSSNGAIWAWNGTTWTQYA